MVRRPALDRSALAEQLLAVHGDGCSDEGLSRLAAELVRIGDFGGVRIMLGAGVTGRTGRAGSRSALRTLASLPDDRDEPRETGAVRSWLVRDPAGTTVGQLQCVLGTDLAPPASDQLSLIEQVCQQLGIAIRQLQLEQQVRDSYRLLVDEQAERRLAERAFDLMFDESAIGMATLSLAPERPGLVVAVNAAFCEMLGREDTELLDHAFMVLIHPDDRAASNSAMRRAMAGRRTPVRSRPRLLHADASEVPVQLTACPLFDDEERARYALLQIEDLRARVDVGTEPAPRQDPLLGLPAGVALDQAMQQLLDRVKRLNTAGVALICDMDQLISSSGQGAAEILRQGVAGVLRQSLRGDDLVGRISQNRFVVLAEEVPAEHAETVARRITEALHERLLPIEIGVALLTADLSDPRVLVKRATSAMFGARTAGLPYLLYTLSDGVLYSSTEEEAKVSRQVLYSKPGWREH